METGTARAAVIRPANALPGAVNQQSRVAVAKSATPFQKCSLQLLSGSSNQAYSESKSLNVSLINKSRTSRRIIVSANAGRQGAAGTGDRQHKQQHGSSSSPSSSSSSSFSSSSEQRLSHAAVSAGATNRPESASIAQDKEKASANISVGALMNEAEATEVENAWEALMRWGKFWRVKETNGSDEETTKVVIFGGGAFGTALAHMLARNNAELDVVILHRFEEDCKNINELHCNSACHPGIILPDNVRATTDPREAISGAQYALHAIPVQPSAAFLQSIAQYVPPTLPILCVSKGLELGTMEMMTEVIPRGLGNPRQPVVILSGPTFAVEIIRELPTALVAASKDLALAKRAQKLLASKTLRVNTTTDVVGVEMAGALKNVLAIAAGIVEGMQLGNNCMAALVAQGCSEIRWLAEKMGAKPTTLAGLSGTGDIMLTCFVSLSRNRTVGVRLGSGEKLEDILSSMTQVAEGVATSGAVISLARKYRVQMPVLTAVARILEGKLEPKEAVMELMSLPQVEEK